MLVHFCLRILTVQAATLGWKSHSAIHGNTAESSGNRMDLEDHLLQSIHLSDELKEGTGLLCDHTFIYDPANFN